MREPKKDNRILGVRHAAFPTRDLGRAISFYRDVLGFAPYYERSEDWAMLACGDTSLSLIRAEHDRRAHWQGGSHHSHLGIVVASREAVAHWQHRLKQARVSSVGKATEHRDGSYGFYFRDLDGNPLELIFIPYRSHHLPAPDEGWLLVGSLADIAERLREHVPGVRVAVAATVEQGLKQLLPLPPVVRVFAMTAAEIERAQTAHPEARIVIEAPLSEHPWVREAMLAAIAVSPP